MRTLVMLCAAAVVAAPPAIAATEPATPSPAPAATAPAAALPEIGRTKALRPACIILRDLVEPSVHAAQRGDRRFNQTLPVMRKYVKLVADNNPVGRGMVLMQIERSELAIAQEQLAIAKALGDPRVAESVADPDARALRASLQAIEAAQAIQRNFLHRFAHRERLDYMQGDLGSGRGGGTLAEGTVRRGPGAGIADPKPDSPFIHDEDVPLSGDGDHNQQVVEHYMRIVAGARLERENAAAPAIARSVDGCRP